MIISGECTMCARLSTQAAGRVPPRNMHATKAWQSILGICPRKRCGMNSSDLGAQAPSWGGGRTDCACWWWTQWILHGRRTRVRAGPARRELRREDEPSPLGGSLGRSKPRPAASAHPVDPRLEAALRLPRRPGGALAPRCRTTHNRRHWIAPPGSYSRYNALIVSPSRNKLSRRFTSRTAESVVDRCSIPARSRWSTPVPTPVRVSW